MSVTNETANRLRAIADAVEDQAVITTFPPMVSGRVLHADADAFAYRACNLHESYEENRDSLNIIIDTWKKLAGAEYIYLYLTMGSKSGREKIAQLMEYQGRREVDEDKWERVSKLRQCMADKNLNSPLGIPLYTQEADDAVCHAMHQAVAQGTDEVMYSQDKDLWMVPGRHLNHNTYQIEEFPSGYGKCELIKNVDGQNKLKGKGTSWFWHQLLMGDNADDIPGVRTVAPVLWKRYKPTKAYTDAVRRIRSGRMPSGKQMTTAQKVKAHTTLQDIERDMKPKKVGSVMAYNLLQDCRTDQEAFIRCKHVYNLHYGAAYSFKNWQGNQCICTSDEMMLEQARLLWMQRWPGDDVKEWMLNLHEDNYLLIGDTNGYDL